MATADQKKEAARQRKANQRARERGLPEPYPTTAPQEEQEDSLTKQRREEDIAFARSIDVTGKFYKSECRSCESLLAIYYGNNDLSKEEVEVVDAATGKKKQNIPNPSKQALRIRAVETEIDGIVVKIDPDADEHVETVALSRIFEVNGVVRFRDWLDLRDKARRNLFWLSHVMGKSLFHNSHQMICDKFVQKNFDGAFFPGFERKHVNSALKRQERFANDDFGFHWQTDGKPTKTPTRTMMLLAPRSGWKSTIDGIDAVQWMLNTPDVRIMIITAFKPLAKLFLKEVKRYFYLAPRGTASNFQLLFPEYVLTGVDGRSETPIECPAAVIESKEPHLWITSMESSATGMRCDICKADDSVDPKNSNSDELREQFQHDFNGMTDLVEPWGFIDIIGTRYFTNDYYGTRVEKDEDGQISPISTLMISAWYPKPGFETAYEVLLSLPNGMSKVTEDMVDLWFPYKLSFRELRNKLLAKKERNTSNVQKERSFRNQQLNIATDPSEVDEFLVHFDREALRHLTYPRTAAPATGRRVVTIDWAYSEKRTSDYSVLASINIHQRDDETYEMIVEDLEYDKWKSSVLAERIVLFLRKHQPEITLIEKALGHDLLLMALDMYARKYNCLEVLGTIRWVDVDNSPNAKANRIKCLEILVADERLHFVVGPWLDETYKQFERFTGEIKKGRKDDIPDSISLATKLLPREMFYNVSRDPEIEERERDEEERKYLKQLMYERMFGGNLNTGIANPRPPKDPSGEQQPAGHPGFREGAPNLPAPTGRERARGKREPEKPVEPAAPVKPMDPRMIIFGNKGPWRL